MTARHARLVAAPLALALAGFALYAARYWNPTRPLLGVPTGSTSRAFARQLNALRVGAGEPITGYVEDLSDSPSASSPVMGIILDTVGGRPRTSIYAWRGRRWVLVSLDGVRVTGPPDPLVVKAQERP